MDERVGWRGLAVRWVSDEPQPGWVEVQCVDALGRTWSFFDKPPIFSESAHWSESAMFPIETTVECRVLSPASSGADTAAVRIASIWGDAADGTNEFEVLPESLVR